MSEALEILVGHQTVSNVDLGVKDLDARRVVIGPDASGLGLQVLICDWTGSGTPSVTAMRQAHSSRVGNHIFPCVVATVENRESVWLVGPVADAPPVGSIPISQAERVLQAALDEPTGLQARHRLSHLLDSVRSTDIAGMTNAGLFATHYLTEGVRDENGWADASSKARLWLKLRGEPLVTAMGFSVKSTKAKAHILTTEGHNQPRAVAVLLNEAEGFEADSPRFAVSPVRFGLNVAQREDAPWLIVLRGSQVRLYAARPGVGVGSRGQAETFFELDLALLDEADAGYLQYAFSADALRDGGLVQRLIAGSEQYATGLGERLRARVYEHVVPTLAVAVANQLDRLDHGDNLALSYRITLRILFRLLFQAYAEDRGLLPYGRNDRYTRNSLKRQAIDIVEQPDMVFDPESHSIWSDLRQVWEVIDTGDRAWDVPPYNGGLFGADPDLHAAGALIKQLELDNKVVGTALRNLLVDNTEDGEIGAVDFSSLSVREFGTIYEGLLESSLSRADQDLTVDENLAYVPAKGNDKVVVKTGDIYFHNASGERKASGSYFTPRFAVEHLLERALDPALDEHLQGIGELFDKGDEATATEQFFDFRVADLAMGSGHFLVSAIDHIEAGMGAFLVDRELPGITDELRRLEATAHENLGVVAVDYEIEPSTLLRRQIARRCVYGLDINDVAVELARVAIWIHTFVPGLPMSSLDHNLICADSLTGIGTVDEAIEALDPTHEAGQLSLYSGPIIDALEEAKELLVDAANASEATKAEVRQAAEIYRRATNAARPTGLLFDAAVAARTGIAGPLEGLDLDGIRAVAAQPDVSQQVVALRPAHMPYLFPEVFLRDNPGFDVVVGNPPWEKIKVEEHAWWGLRFAGLRGVPQKQKNERLAGLKSDRADLVAEYNAEVQRTDRMRSIIASGPYPGIGRGDIDLYQAFAWRNWHLLRQGGYTGAVLPRGALSGSGTVEWRRSVLQHGTFADVCFLTNTARWIFDMEPRYTVALCVARRGTQGGVSFCGPFHTFTEYVGGRDDTTTVDAAEFSSWSESLSFPTVPDAESGEIMKLMKRQPPFNSTVGFEFRPYRELDATNDKHLFDVDIESKGDIPVFAGASFDLWSPDAGEAYAMAKSEDLIPHLLGKAKGSMRRSVSPFYGLIIEDVDDLPISGPRIAFRDVTRATDTRTMRACLLPPRVAVQHKAPYLVRRSGSVADEAFVLAVLSSIPFDWYARRWIEISFTFQLLGPMPMPRPDVDDPLRVRVVKLGGRLAAIDDRYAVWADAVGVPVGLLEEPQRSDAIAELDALVAHLYGLSEGQLLHVFETFHRGWDYTDRWEAVQRHYRAWETTT